MPVKPARDTGAASAHSTDRAAQRRLSIEQIELFHHDIFVEDQLRHFRALVPLSAEPLKVVDVGGGCGFFARGLTQRVGARTTVIDMDPDSVAACHAAGVPALLGDALMPPPELSPDVVSFNLILHHLVAASERDTRALQERALKTWGQHAPMLFINEYVYESLVGTLSGRLIFAVTSSRILSAFGRAVSRFVPSLRANTFGVGVRFRAHAEWLALFRQAGFEVMDTRLGDGEPVTAARRILLIKTIRRDSFVLQRSKGQST